MSREYLNNRWCVRCNRCDPTPYLKKYFNLMTPKGEDTVAIDIGCGNGRNSRYLMSYGINTTPYDMVNDFGNTMTIGEDRIPKENGSIDLILCNYLLMFLSRSERLQVINEIKRVAAPGCYLIVELYKAKDANKFSQAVIFGLINWDKIRYSKDRFIARKAL